ncbi:protein disulfide-isomerase A5 isoform X1 [Nerophis lumbriciformis]|uniref:protein disulfide-isomerase A5 isoform X1 n=1 Tax=Nerophis lumbriciformis TaxID=546530 RepID=UPI002AE06481|nr:protein disulfide-isomerase A5-like isoform X1 [Nerophis lumbriciformis]
MASRSSDWSQMREDKMLLLLLLVWLTSVLDAVKVSPLIEKISDHKDLKKLLRTRTNVLVLYTKTASSGDTHLKLLSDVALTVKGQGTIAWVNCGDSEGRKLCKKVKVEPSSASELLHYRDGTFHLLYDRPLTFKSMVAFLKDPSGPPLWEENPQAKDILHVATEKDFRKLLKKEDRPILMMFYAPWCGVCKRMQPVFQQAATETKGRYVLAAMNVHPAEFDGLKQEFDVKGYPTFCYFHKGKFLFHYENYGASAKDIADWMKNPQAVQPKSPEVPWSETESAVFHLTDESFDRFLDDHPAALVMFYAPWCGHCKKMKPEYEEAAQTLNKDLESPGVLAAMDTTVHKSVGERLKISGFPTLKYFEKGRDTFTLPHLRSKDKIMEFMHSPQAPPPPEQSWEEQPSSVLHLGLEDFREALKKKKHALVMFYAPWCPHCKNAVPHFTAAAELLKEDRKIAYGAVDCTRGQNQDLCKQEAVEGYPTFSHYNYGKFVDKYHGERQEVGFSGFMRSLRGRHQEKAIRKKEEL